MEKAAFWQEVKDVCCLHAKLITFQCTQVTDDDLADRFIGNHNARRRNVAVPNVCLQTLTLSLESSLSSRFFHSFPKQRARTRLCQNNLSKPLLVPYEVTQNSFHRTQRMRITSLVTQDGACVLVVNYLSFYSC